MQNPKQPTSTQLETEEVSVGNSARTEEIRRRAYEVYLECGKRSGHDVDDWLQAEQELERGVLGPRLDGLRRKSHHVRVSASVEMQQRSFN
jgi:hypothetical protein